MHQADAQYAHTEGVLLSVAIEHMGTNQRNKNIKVVYDIVRVQKMTTKIYENKIMRVQYLSIMQTNFLIQLIIDRRRIIIMQKVDIKSDINCSL